MDLKIYSQRNGKVLLFVYFHFPLYIAARFLYFKKWEFIYDTYLVPNFPLQHILKGEFSFANVAYLHNIIICFLIFVPESMEKRKLTRGDIAYTPNS